MMSRRVIGEGRAHRLLAALTVAVTIGALGVWAQNSALVGVNYDDGIYALLAKAVAQGDGYRLTFLPQELPGVKYPPVYPLSLVPFWTLAASQESALQAMKIWNGLLIGIAAGLFTLLLASLRILPAYLAAAGGLLGFAAGSMMLVTAGLLSEPTYLVILFGALWATDAIPRDARGPGFFAVGLLAALVLLTRAVGIAAVGAVIVGLWARAGRRAAMAAAATAIAVTLPWVVYTLTHAGAVPEALVPRYGSYAQLYLANLAGSLEMALAIFWTNLGAILQTLGGKLAPQLGPLAQTVSGGFLIVLAALGSRIVGGRAPATVTYPWLYLALVSVWSFPPFRFVFIVFPLLLVLAAVCWLEIARRVVTAVRRPLWAGALRIGVIAIGLLVPLNLAYTESRALGRRVWDGAALQKSIASAGLIEWVRSNTPKDAVVAFELDPLVSLHTGRRAVPNNYEPVHVWYRSGEPPLEPLAALFVTAGVDYVAVRGDVPQAASTIDSLLEAYPNSLHLQFVDPQGVLIFSADLEAFASHEPNAAADRRGGR